MNDSTENEAKPTAQPEVFLRRTQIMPALVPISTATFWRWVKNGSFPAPVKVNGITMWRSSDVHAWIERSTAKAA